MRETAIFYMWVGMLAGWMIVSRSITLAGGQGLLAAGIGLMLWCGLTIAWLSGELPWQ